MDVLFGCGICGAAVTDATRHARFHSQLDRLESLLHDVESDAQEALQLAVELLRLQGGDLSPGAERPGPPLPR